MANDRNSGDPLRSTNVMFRSSIPAHFFCQPLHHQVRFLEQQLCLAQESADVEGGSIEVLEGLLRQRDTDTELCRGMGLKSLEIGLKISLLETDTGGQTVEVSEG